MQIRQAQLDDTQIITELFCLGVEKWQRINEQGHVEDLPYEALKITDRWLHGGAWMSVETAAIWLSHLLRVQALPLVVLVNGRIVGYAEAFWGTEPDPIRDHLHLGQMVIHPDYQDSDVSNALMQHLLQQSQGVGRLTTSFPDYDTASQSFFRRFGFDELKRLQRFNLTAQTGQAFYKAVEHEQEDASQIGGWFMPVGRLTNARHQWETYWARLWDAMPEITRQQRHRIHFNAAGQPALVCFHQQLFNLRSADVYCWSPKPLTAQLLVAIRDWSHRNGYRNLSMVVDRATANLLAEAEAATHYHLIYAVDA